MYFSVSDHDSAPYPRDTMMTSYACWDSSLDEKTVQHRAPSSDDGYASPDVPGSDTSSSSVNQQLPRAVHFRDRPSENVNVMRTIDDVTCEDRQTTRHVAFSTDSRGCEASEGPAIASSRQISAALNRVAHERPVTLKRTENDFENKLKGLLLDCYDDTQSSATSTLTRDQSDKAVHVEQRTSADYSPQEQCDANYQRDMAGPYVSSTASVGGRSSRPAVPPTYEQACERQGDFRAHIASRQLASAACVQREIGKMPFAAMTPTKPGWTQDGYRSGSLSSHYATQFHQNHSKPSALPSSGGQSVVSASHNHLIPNDSDSGSTPIDSSTENAEPRPKSILRKRKRHNVRFSLEPNTIHELVDVDYGEEPSQSVHPDSMRRDGTGETRLPNTADFEPDHSCCGGGGVDASDHRYYESAVDGQLDNRQADCGYTTCESRTSGNALVEAKVTAWLQHKHAAMDGADHQRLGAHGAVSVDNVDDSSCGYIDATKTRQVMDAIYVLLKQRPHQSGAGSSSSRDITHQPGAVDVGRVTRRLPPSDPPSHGHNYNPLHEQIPPCPPPTCKAPLPPGYVRLSDRSLVNNGPGYREIDDYSITHNKSTMGTSTGIRGTYDPMMDTRNTGPGSMRTDPFRTGAIESASSAAIRQRLEPRNVHQLPRQ